jgi:hypothetical protein
MAFLEHPNLPLEWKEIFANNSRFLINQKENKVIINCRPPPRKFSTVDLEKLVKHTYIHITLDEECSLQMFDLDLATGEKTPLSCLFQGELGKLLEKARFTIDSL